jgi:DNA-binding NarL/FixJ family response regulator
MAEALRARDGFKDAAQAREQAELALAGAEQFGMSGVRTGGEQMLAGLGARARLTPREREIAGLVASGATNRDIARSLVLSERTVDTHVQNILSKLDFQSRTQIATWASASGLSAGT